MACCHPYWLPCSRAGCRTNGALMPAIGVLARLAACGRLAGPVGLAHELGSALKAVATAVGAVLVFDDLHRVDAASLSVQGWHCVGCVPQEVPH